jgi:pimeloyl-ACP methyl ester carboxylesterase
MNASLCSLLRFFLLVACLVLPCAAWAQDGAIGIVVMHGKGGAPTRLVADLARSLEGKGYLVANMEMPWSGRRNYDVPVATGEEEVAAALEGLRRKGAKKLFIAGHSQGGAFALYLAGRLSADGVIVIAPGGDVSTAFFSGKVSASLARAKALVAEGKGAERAELQDFEGSRDSYTVLAVPAAYVTWFDPAGAMNMERSARAATPAVPFLWVAPTNDYPALRKAHPQLFRMLPANPRHRFVEPNADHRGAPTASVDEIVRWTQEITAK